MRTPEQAYAERPTQGDTCKAGYEGCTRTVQVHVQCVTEGRDTGLCGACYGVWRTRAAQNPVLLRRCPGCESAWEVSTSALGASQPTLPPTFTGPVAEALRHAMLMEGVLEDVRQRVLARLARDASWLQDVSDPREDAAEYERLRRRSHIDWDTVQIES